MGEISHRWTRRDALKGGIGISAAGLGLGVGLFADHLYNQLWSPEAEKRKAEERKAEREAFEAVATLGASPSDVISLAGWRIQYPQDDPTIQYITAEGRGTSITVLGAYHYLDLYGEKQHGLLDQFAGKEYHDAEITLDTYTSSKGEKIPQLNIIYDYYRSKGTIYYSKPYLITGEQIPHFNTSVVEFTNDTTRETKYVSFHWNNKSNSFKPQLMTPVHT